MSDEWDPAFCRDCGWLPCECFSCTDECPEDCMADHQGEE